MTIDDIASKFRAEEKRIKRSRLLAWCSIGAEQDLLGIECLPLTVRAWIDLSLYDNEIIQGETPTHGEICAYVWRNCKSFEIDNRRKAKRWQKRIAKAYKKQGYFAAIADISEHMQAAFEEVPQSNSVNKSAINNRFPDIEGIVGAVDEVAARYGITPDDVMDWPLNRVFQCQKAARLATIPDYKLRQPESLMKIRRDYLQQINGN